jgi:hypothetical protein
VGGWRGYPSGVDSGLWMPFSRPRGCVKWGGGSSSDRSGDRRCPQGRARRRSSRGSQVVGLEGWGGGREGGTRGRECVRRAWRGLRGRGGEGGVVRPGSPRPLRRQHRGGTPVLVPGEASQLLQQRGNTAGGGEDRVCRRGSSDGDSCVREDGQQVSSSTGRLSGG